MVPPGKAAHSNEEVAMKELARLTGEALLLFGLLLLGFLFL